MQTTFKMILQDNEITNDNDVQHSEENWLVVIKNKLFLIVFLVI